MTFQARIALFDNSSAVADNANCPVMTGKLEIPADQVLELAELLDAQQEHCHGDRRYKVLDLSVWSNANGNALLYSGKARMPLKSKPVTLDNLREQQRKIAELISQSEESEAAASAPVDDADEPF